MTDEEMNALIDKVSSEFTGQIDDLSAAIGILVLGRLYGWRVMRLVSNRRHWAVANKIFGDMKKLLPERGKYAHKSIGLKIADKFGDYWALIRGSVKVIPEKERRKVT